MLERDALRACKREPQPPPRASSTRSNCRTCSRVLGSRTRARELLRVPHDTDQGWLGASSGQIKTVCEPAVVPPPPYTATRCAQRYRFICRVRVCGGVRRCARRAPPGPPQEPLLKALNTGTASPPSPKLGNVISMLLQQQRDDITTLRNCSMNLRSET